MDQNLNTFIYQLVNLCLQTPSWALLQDNQKEVLAHNLEEHFFQVAMEALVEKLSTGQVFMLEYYDIKEGTQETVIIELSESSAQVSQDVEESLKREYTNIVQSVKSAQ